MLNRKHRELTERVTVGDCVINLMTSSQKNTTNCFPWYPLWKTNLRHHSGKERYLKEDFTRKNVFFLALPERGEGGDGETRIGGMGGWKWFGQSPKENVFFWWCLPFKDMHAIRSLGGLNCKFGLRCKFADLPIDVVATLTSECSNLPSLWYRKWISDFKRRTFVSIKSFHSTKGHIGREMCKNI